MKTRVALVAALLAGSLAACTVKRFPGDCYAAPTTTVRTKNRALIEAPVNPDFPTNTALAASC